MRLVLREYLSMLKESGELDVLLPDLLLAMKIDPLTRPTIGTRQFGVDVPAVGPDPADGGRRKLLLFTVKRGNITRSVWNAGKQAVRPSLDEILDIYLQNHVRPEHQELPKKIVVVTGGELGQDVEPDWTGYIRRNSQRSELGEVEFDFWGGDVLSGLMDRHLFDEYLFPEPAQKQIRKTIALADQNEQEPVHFYALVQELFFEKSLPTDMTQGAVRAREKALTLLKLTLRIVFRWCEESGNLKPALLASERSILLCWEWLVRSDLLSCRVTTAHLQGLLALHGEFGGAYADKIRPYSRIRDGLFGYGGDRVEYPVRTFEIVGHLGLAAASLVYRSLQEEGEDAHNSYDRASDIAGILEGVIRNNPGALTPLFDSHSIDIGLGLIAVAQAGSNEFSRWWVENQAYRVVYAVRIGRSYPIATDSYEDLAAASVGEGKSVNELFKLSTLLPMLSEWMAVLGQDDVYATFSRAVREHLDEVNLQLWFPTVDSESHLYTTNAGYSSGATLSSIQLPDNLRQQRDRIVRTAEAREPWEMLSCLRHGFPIIALMASRHYRTPLVPALWQDAVVPMSGQDPTK